MSERDERERESDAGRDRLEHLESLGVTPRSSAEFVKTQMMKRADRGGVKVLTNPSFTVGADKDMDEDLNRIAQAFPFAKDIIEYLLSQLRLRRQPSLPDESA